VDTTNYNLTKNPTLHLDVGSNERIVHGYVVTQNEINAAISASPITISADGKHATAICSVGSPGGVIQMLPVSASLEELRKLQTAIASDCRAGLGAVDKPKSFYRELRSNVHGRNVTKEPKPPAEFAKRISMPRWNTSMVRVVIGVSTCSRISACGTE
jgi:hypothetical protein